MGALTVRAMDAAALDADLPAFANILHACVHGGAAVSFILPFSVDEAAAFWRHQVRPGVIAGDRVLLAAYHGGKPVGTVQVLLAGPPNQAHRAEIAKLLTHPASRRNGAARLLMASAEAAAIEAGKTVMTLDTRTDDVAEGFYAGIGYSRAGVIPDFARDPDSNRLHGTTYMYKRIA